MEVHRLKPMIAGYDPSVFNRLYKKTEGLRKKLASEINPHRFGLTFEDILSWFDDKFILVFNKYYYHKEEVLLGHLINSLKLFKCRILRAAYTVKFSQKIIQVEDYNVYQDELVEESYQEQKERMEEIMTFMKGILSFDALNYLNLCLVPPPYILTRLESNSHGLKYKIPDYLILEYLELPNNKKALQYLAELKEEVETGIAKAKYHFNCSTSPVLL